VSKPPQTRGLTITIAPEHHPTVPLLSRDRLGTTWKGRTATRTNNSVRNGTATSPKKAKYLERQKCRLANLDQGGAMKTMTELMIAINGDIRQTGLPETHAMT
jgi:hypothetical protein